MDVFTGFLYIVRSILALGAIILLANFVLKKLQKYSIQQTKVIHILERVSVTKSSALALVKIGSQYYLMSLTENSSEILKEYSKDEAEEIEKQIQENKESEHDYSDVLSSLNGVREKYQKMFEEKMMK